MGRHLKNFPGPSLRRTDTSLDVTPAVAFTVGPDGRWTEFCALAGTQSARGFLTDFVELPDAKADAIPEEERTRE